MNAFEGIGFILLITLIQVHGDVITGCGGKLNDTTSLDYGFPLDKNNCNWIVEPNQVSTLIFDIFQLYEEDKVVIKDGNTTLFSLAKSDLSALQSFIVNSTITLAIETANTSATRRLKAHLQNGCKYTYLVESNRTPLKFASPINLTPEKITCSVGLNNALGSKAIFNFAVNDFKFGAENQLQLNGAIITNSTCEFIVDKVDLNFSLAAKSPSSIGKFQVEYVNKDCSKTLTKLEPISITNLTNFDPNLPCRYIILANEDKSKLYGKLKIIKNFGNQDAYIQINNGANRTATQLIAYNSFGMYDSQSDIFIGSHGCLYIMFNYVYLTIQLQISNSGGLYHSSGNLTISKTVEKIQDYYLLEVEEGQQVYLSPPGTINGSLAVFEGFTDGDPLLESSHIPYPIISSSNKMMLRATSIKNDIALTFNGVPPGCNQMNVKAGGLYSPYGQCQSKCQMIVPPFSSGEYSLHIPIVQIGSNSSIQIYEVDNTTPLMNVQSPINEIYIKSDKGFLIQVNDDCSSKIKNNFTASFELLKDCSSSKTLEIGEIFNLTSPNYPNSYPINSHCITKINTTKVGKILFVTINAIDLAKGHSLALVDSEQLRPFQKDFITVANKTVEFKAFDSTGKSELKNLTAKGFELTFTAADCGGTQTTKDGTLEPPKNSSVKACIWTIKVPQVKTSNTTIIYFELTKLGADGVVNFVDGGYSKLNKTSTLKKGDSNYSLTDEMIIFYRGTTSDFSLKYEAVACNHTCENGLCMRDAWICNDKNDCGDGSDEINCKNVPPVVRYGYSDAALTAAIIFSFGGGLLVAFLSPKIYQRYRSASYRQFTADIN